jgi:Cu(I)/Ag(I) efflux system membrane fusion protein
MKHNKLWISVAAVAALAVAGYGLYDLGRRHAAHAEPTAAAPAAPASPAQQGLPQNIAQGEEATRRHIASGLKAGDTDPATGRRILYYHDPMVPGNRFDKPGKSPFMDMMLVPMYADGDADTGGVTVSPRIQQNLGLRTAEVVEGTLAPQVAAVGSIEFNERDQAVVQARASGFVERLLVRATLDRVRQGQPLAEIHVPDWVAAQEEFLAVRRMRGDGLDALVAGARARMRQAGMSEEQIQRVEQGGRPDARVRIAAPIAGLVTEVGVREGMAVMPGATLFRINGFGSVWAHAEVLESQAALVRPGARVVATTPAVPGMNFEGRVQALLPGVDLATRTLKARVELPNRDGRLVPGMFVSMTFREASERKAVLVPSEALIHTGRRTVAILAEEQGRFRPVEVQPGVESGGQTEVRAGLQPGQRVVVSSQFLIDSEASLRGVEARLNAGAARRYQAEAVVDDIAKDMLLLTHDPIPALKWDVMTMEFKLPPSVQLPPGLKVGDRVQFEFSMDKDGVQVTRIAPLPAQGGKR